MRNSRPMPQPLQTLVIMRKQHRAKSSWFRQVVGARLANERLICPKTESVYSSATMKQIGCVNPERYKILWFFRSCWKNRTTRTCYSGPKLQDWQYWKDNSRPDKPTTESIAVAGVHHLQKTTNLHSAVWTMVLLSLPKIRVGGPYSKKRGSRKNEWQDPVCSVRQNMC
jgi:hypothetical protein